MTLLQTLFCGLVGIPPSNGVIPQSPMHTKSLATLKHQVLLFLCNQACDDLLTENLYTTVLHFLQLLRNKLVATARKSIKRNASLGQLYGSMQEAYNQIQTPLVFQPPPGLVRSVPKIPQFYDCYLKKNRKGKT